MRFVDLGLIKSTLPCINTNSFRILYCPPPFRRKAEGHSFWLSVIPSVRLFVRPSVCPSVLPSPYRVCTLCAQLLLQFYSDSFETLQMFLPSFENIACGFGYNPQINSSHFFRNLNLVIFRAFWQWKRMDSGYLVCATPPTVSFRFFWNFTDVFTRLWRYARGLDMLLRLIFITFARNLNLVIFRSFWQWKWMDRGYLVCATPPTVSFWFFWNFTVVFIMLWRYAYGLYIILSLIVSTFSQFELSHFWAFTLRKFMWLLRLYLCN